MVACSGGSEGEGEGTGGEEDTALTVWTTEDQADRVAKQQDIFNASGDSGSRSNWWRSPRTSSATVLASAAASNELPDAIGAVSLNALNQLATDGVVDSDAAKAIVDDLGADTFSPRALELTQMPTAPSSAVPSDGWAQLLVYRNDCSKQPGSSRRRPTTPSWRLPRS